MTTARWETPYIAEWLAYHQALGFEHVYLYCNDDEPGELFTAAAGWIESPDPFVTFIHWPHQGQQWWMHLHFLQTFRAQTEWVLFLDVDEFLALRRDPDIASFMRPRSAKTDCIYFYWTMFGHMGFAERPSGSVLRRYVRRQAGLNPWTKTITRSARINPALLQPGLRGNIVHPHHGWDRKFSAPGFRSEDVLGADMTDYWPDNDQAFSRLFVEPGRAERVLEEAVIHHYAFRSEADFRRRVERGVSGDFGGQALWGGKTPEEAAAFLAEINAVEDRTLADRWETHLSRRASKGSPFPPSAAPLVSRNRPALQSSVWTSDGAEADPAAQAANGVDGRALSGTWAFHTGWETEPWWRVDLGGPHRIAEVRLHNRIAGAERADGVRISLSGDGADWRRVHTRTEPGSFGGADGRPLRWLPRTEEIARYVRLDLPEGVLHLEQVEVFGTPLAEV